jgi:hypothetical protein
MRRTWTIIGVADVGRSVEWYQSLLDLPLTTPEHDYFGQILDSTGTVQHPADRSSDSATSSVGLEPQAPQ